MSPHTRSRVGVGIIGVGNLGGELVKRLAHHPGRMELLAVADIDADADSLNRARELGIAVSPTGAAGVVENPAVDIVFDATTAAAHTGYATKCNDAGKVVIDLTPAATGRCVVPLVNIGEALEADNISLLTSAAQATIPLVRELSALAPLMYVEVVSVVESSTVGPAMRLDFDACTVATARAVEQLGPARAAKAIMVLSPAEPPTPMCSTVHVVPYGDIDEVEVAAGAREAVRDLQTIVPGYVLARGPTIEPRDTPWGRRLTVSMRVEVTGVGDSRPALAGNVAVMTCVAQEVGEQVAARLLQAAAVSVV